MAYSGVKIAKKWGAFRENGGKRPRKPGINFSIHHQAYHDEYQ
jgi:hypothetical protein